MSGAYKWHQSPAVVSSVSMMPAITAYMAQVRDDLTYNPFWKQILAHDHADWI